MQIQNVRNWTGHSNLGRGSSSSKFNYCVGMTSHYTDHHLKLMKINSRTWSMRGVGGFLVMMMVLVQLTSGDAALVHNANR